MKFFAFISLICITIACIAKEPRAIEQDLMSHIKKINNWSCRSGKCIEGVNSFDSLINENSTFKAKLLDYAINEPSVMSYSFDSLKKYMNITTSEDKKFRIYSWKTGTKDKMIYYNNVFQYESHNQMYSTTLTKLEEEYNPRGYYTDIETLKTDSDTIYLGYFHAFYSPRDYAESFEAFRIEGDQLKDSIRVFKTEEGISSSICVLYNPISKKREKKKLLFFNAKQKEIKVRQTDNYGIILNKSKVLAYKGKQFEYAK